MLSQIIFFERTKALIKIPRKNTSQSGFTLIELIAVIVILGILAAVAIPRFANLRRGAIIATTEGIRGAVESATTMAYAKSVVEGVEGDPSATITVGSQTIDVAYGYPAGTASGISLLIEYPAGNWKSRASIFPGAWVYWHGKIAEDAGVAQCYVRYRQPTAPDTRPVIDTVTSGC